MSSMLRPVLVWLAAAGMLLVAAACQRGVVVPLDERADPAAVTTVTVTGGVDTLTVLGSMVTYFARAQEADGSWLRDQPFRWTVDPAGIVALQEWSEPSVADVRAVAEGRNRALGHADRADLLASGDRT